MLFLIVNLSSTSADELNYVLRIICECPHQWKLEFNHDPSKQATSQLPSQRKYPIYHPTLLFNGNKVRSIALQWTQAPRSRSWHKVIFWKTYQQEDYKKKKDHWDNHTPLTTCPLKLLIWWIRAIAIRLLWYNLPSPTSGSLNYLMEI